MTIGEKLQQTRKIKGLTQEELGQKVNLSKKTISRLETNETKLTLEIAVLLVEALDITLDYLVRDIAPTAVKKGEMIPEEFQHQLALLEKLSPDDIPHIQAVINAFVTKAQLQAIIK